MGTPMDLDFQLLETGSLLLAVLVTTFTLQVSSDRGLASHLIFYKIDSGYGFRVLCAYAAVCLIPVGWDVALPQGAGTLALLRRYQRMFLRAQDSHE